MPLSFAKCCLIKPASLEIIEVFCYMIIIHISQPILVFWEQYNSEGSFISVCVSDLHLTYHNYTSTVIIIIFTQTKSKILVQENNLIYILKNMGIHNMMITVEV